MKNKYILFLLLSMTIVLFGFLSGVTMAADSCQNLATCNASNNLKDCCVDSNTPGTCIEFGGSYMCSSKTSNSSKCDPACGDDKECRSVGGEYACVPKAPKASASEKSTQGDASVPPITFTNPLKYSSLQGFLNNGLSVLRSIIVVLSIIFIVIGGVMYIISAGNDDMMKKAKGAITASLIGLAIGIAAPSFLKEIYTIFGAKDDSGIDTSQLTGPTLTEIAMNFLNFLLSIVGILAIIMLIIGGIMYLTSVGDDDRIKSARKIVTWSIVGIIVSLASMVIVRQIASLLSQ